MRGQADRTARVVQLNPTAYRWCLVPQQPAFNIHVFDGENQLVSNQGRQFACLDREFIQESCLCKGFGEIAIGFVGRATDIEISGPECGQRIRADRRKELQPTIGALNKQLRVIQIGCGMRVCENRVVL